MGGQPEIRFAIRRPRLPRSRTGFVLQDRHGRFRVTRDNPKADTTFGNFRWGAGDDILSLGTMTYMNSRAPRVSFKEITPAVVRLRNGWRVSGKLQTISATGGLLSLPKALDQGSEVKLMFLTQTGPVLGAAEMLSPVPGGSQPFKFTALFNDDRRRLQAAIQLSQDQSRTERKQLEIFRAW